MKKITIFLLLLSLFFPVFVSAQDLKSLLESGTDFKWDQISQNTIINLENCPADYCSCAFDWESKGKEVKTCSTGEVMLYAERDSGLLGSSDDIKTVIVSTNLPARVCRIEGKKISGTDLLSAFGVVSTFTTWGTAILWKKTFAAIGNVSFWANSNCQILTNKDADGCSCTTKRNTGNNKIIVGITNSKPVDRSWESEIRSFMKKKTPRRCPHEGELPPINNQLKYTDCTNLYAEESCCCWASGATQVSILNTCQKIKEVPGLFTNCAAFLNHASTTGVLKPLDNNGGCDAYSQELISDQANASSTQFGISLDKIRSDAKSLNPMNFKTGTTGVQQLISKVVGVLTFAMGSILLLFYVYAGILWMTAAGNQERIGQAKKIVVWSTLGVVVILSSYLIVQAVFNFAG